MAHAAELSFRTVGPVDVAIISPNDPGAMTQYAEECRTLGIRFVFDPGQQCARMSGDELRDGLAGAHILICNDYEFELIREKTGMDEKDVLGEVDILIVTKGEKGSTVITKEGHADVAAVPPHRVADPTGVGDAFRAGFIAGLSWGAGEELAAQVGCMLATLVIETVGTQEYDLRRGHFLERFAVAYGDGAAAEVARHLAA
jgi:adenosine kinase